MKKERRKESKNGRREGFGLSVEDRRNVERVRKIIRQNLNFSGVSICAFLCPNFPARFNPFTFSGGDGFFFYGSSCQPIAT
jgi:hypothetical protein